MSEFFSEFAFQFEQNLITADRWKILLEGLGVTVEITIVAIVIGTVLGFYEDVQTADLSHNSERLHRDNPRNADDGAASYNLLCYPRSQRRREYRRGDGRVRTQQRGVCRRDSPRRSRRSGQGSDRSRTLARFQPFSDHYENSYAPGDQERASDLHERIYSTFKGDLYRRIHSDKRLDQGRDDDTEPHIQRILPSHIGCGAVFCNDVYAGEIIRSTRKEIA